MARIHGCATVARTVDGGADGRAKVTDYTARRERQKLVDRSAAEKATPREDIVARVD